MNKLQSIPFDSVEFNPFTKIGKDWGVITAGTEDAANAMTIAWGGVGVMWGKNVAFIFIRDSRYTKEFVDQNDFFSVTFLPEEYRNAMNYLGSHSGRDGDKFGPAGVTLAYRDDIPYINEGDLVFLCHKLSATRIAEDSFLVPEINDKWYRDGDMHTMYVAEILDIMTR